jgi:hypothetical protein
MADARTVPVVDSTGAPLTSGSPSVSAWARAGTPRTAPTVTPVASAPGVWRINASDADETAGTVVLVDFGAGNLPRYWAVPVYLPDGSNQFDAVVVTNPDGTLWAGAAPTVAGYSGTSLTVTPVPGGSTSLFAFTPAAGDLAAGAVGVILGPAGSAQPFWSYDTEPLASGGGGTLPFSPGVAPEALAVDSLVAFLRRWLPAKVAALNALRQAVLTSALSGPFTIPSGAVLRLQGTGSSPTNVTLTSGSRSATQVAADINAASVPGITASADAVGRLVLTSTAAPAASAPSIVIVAQDTGPTGSNAALGWAEGGEHFETVALAAPSWRGVVDGRPLTAPDMGQGFWVMVGNRTARPTDRGIRRDTYNVAVLVDLWRPWSIHAPPHRTREAISSCVRAVRELVESDDGRYLGRQGAGDVQMVTVDAVTVTGDPLQLNESPGVLFDTAQLTLTIRVFQRSS